MIQTNAFTVDVEDYFQVTAFERQIARDQWDEYPQHVVANTHRILDLLGQYNVRATFYVLGWVADKYPTLVREIVAGGHELGSHSYWHRLVYEMTPEEFRTDLRRSRDVIQEAAGIRVEAYRAPSFSITARSTWALEILAEEGFAVDSSIFPVIHDRYGIPGAQPGIHCHQTAAGPLWEFPPSVSHVAGVNLPVSGGGYFRLYPFPLTAHCFARINRGGSPFMFYIHPWEIDPQQPRLPAGSRLSRFRHYLNLGKTQSKLRRLLERFRFGRVCDVMAEHGTKASSGVSDTAR